MPGRKELVDPVLLIPSPAPADDKKDYEHGRDRQHIGCGAGHPGENTRFWPTFALHLPTNKEN
jgi:hypothetical protein